ncbi:MAG: helix-turn-helix domain-containing protein [Chloroflexota bacterium]|nr:helix-turn-helix domain-containing protein [Chloroflexota bacterium]
MPKPSLPRWSRAKALVAVAEGCRYTQAALAAGRKSDDAVSQLMSRFNREGLSVLEPGHGGGAVPVYTRASRERILAEVRRAPDREEDGTATWSLSTLQRALRKAPDGLPCVSTYTVWNALRDAD